METRKEETMKQPLKMGDHVRTQDGCIGTVGYIKAGWVDVFINGRGVVVPEHSLKKTKES